VLLLYGDEPGVVAELRRALDAVVGGKDVQADALPGMMGVAGCSLVLRAGDADYGIRPIDGNAADAFECVLRPGAWTTVAGLLEPLTTPRGDQPASHPRAEPGHAHQYLTEAGTIEWIISTDRSW
jgi:hypothetical protein